MIEVEKKFQPTEEQLASLLKDAKFISEKVLYGVMYDYPDYRLYEKNIRLRRRDGKFELKIPAGKYGDREIDDEKEIKKYFNTKENLEDFVAKNMVLLMEFNTHRKKYKKGEFTIDVDSMDFGYKACEIELLVENEEEIEKAYEKIMTLAKEYNFEIKNLMSKREAYLKALRPDLHKRFYPSK